MTTFTVDAAPFAEEGKVEIDWPGTPSANHVSYRLYRQLQANDIDSVNDNFLTINQADIETDTEGWLPGRYLNLLTATQSNLEVDLAGWASNGALSLTTTKFWSGTHSLAMQATIGSGSYYTYLGGSAAPRVKVSEVYTASAMVRMDTSMSTAIMRIDWYTADAGAYISSSSGRTTGINFSGWTQIAVTGQAPTNATVAVVVVVVELLKAAEFVFIDAVGIFRDPTGNLITNPDFSDDLQTWTSGGGTYWLAAGAVSTVDRGRAYTGRTSAKVVTNGTMYQGIETTIPCLPNKTYTISVRTYKQSGSGTLQLGARGLTSGLNGDASVPVGSGSWQTTTLTFTTGPGDVWLNFAVRENSGLATTFFMDAVQVVVGPTAPTWVPPTKTNLAFGVGTAGSAPTSSLGWSSEQSHGADGVSLKSVSGGTGSKGVGASLGKIPYNGESVAVSGWIRTDRDRSVVVYVQGNQADGYSYAGFTMNSAVFVPANTWTRVTAVGVIGGSIAFLGEIVFLNADGIETSDGETWYVDEFQVEYGNVVTPFASGALGAGYSWESSDNLLPNPSFETDLAGWTGLNQNIVTANQSNFETDVSGHVTDGTCTIAQSTAQSLTGSASMSMTRGGTAGDMYAYQPQPNRTTVTPGQVYTAIASFRAGGAGRAVRLELATFDAAGSFLAVVTGSLFGDHSAGWTQARHTFQVPANVAAVTLSYYVVGAAAGEVHYVDGVGLFADPIGNLVRNPGFEDGALDWFGGSSNTIARTTADAYTGRASLLVTRTNSSPGNAFAGVNLNLIAGKTYTMTARIKRASGSGQVVEALVFGSGGQYIQFPVQVALDDTWKVCSATWKATASENATLIWADDGSAYNTGNAYYLDAVQVVCDSTAPPWVPPTTTNLFTCPGFEDSSVPTYSAGTGVLSNSTDRAYNGSRSIKFLPSVTGQAYFSTNTGAPLLLEGGKTYTYSAWVWSSRAQNAHLQCDVFQRDIATYVTSLAGPTGGVNLPAAGWTRIEFTFTLPIDAPAVGPLIIFPSALPTDTIYYDSQQMELGSVATAYTDGSFGAGFSWESSENLIANPSFETDLTGWTGVNRNLLTANQSSLETDSAGWTGSSIARSTAQSLTGSASLAITSTGAGNADAYITRDTTAPPVKPGQVYTAVASLRAATVGRVVWVQVNWLNEPGTAVLGTSAGMLTADNNAGWTQARVTVQAPSYASRADVQIVVTGISGAGEVHYADAIGLFETPTDNLILNPGFENGILNWNGFGGGTITASTVQSYTGRTSVAVVPSSNVTSLSDFRIYSDYVKASVGTVLTASAYVLSAVATTGRMQIQHDNAAGTGTLSTDQGPVTTIPANVWTRITCTATVPTGGGSDRAEPVVLVNAGATFFVDAVQVVVGSVALPWLPVTTANLVVNPSAEVDTSTTGFLFGSGGSLVRSTAQFYVGSASFLMTMGSSYAHIVWAASQPIPSGIYTLSAWVRPTVTTPLEMCYRTTNGGRVLIGSTGALVANQWQRITGTFTAPADTKGFQPDIGWEAYGVPASGAQVYIDAVQLEAGSVATPYVDGSLGPGYTWEAAENLISAEAAGFEGGTVGGWNGGTSAPFSSTDRSVDGTHSLKVNPNGSTSQRISTPVFPCIAEITYTGSAWIYSTVAQNFAIGMTDNAVAEFAGASGVLVAVPANTWTRVSVTGRALSNQPSAVFYITPPDGSTAVYYVDAVQVEQKDHATAYAVGSTPHAATSRRETPWVLGGTSIENLSRESYHPGPNGAWSVLIGSTPALYTYGMETTVPVAPNTTYTVSGYVDNGCVLSVRDGITVLGSLTVQPGGGSYIRGIVTFTTGPTTTTVVVRFSQDPKYQTTIAGFWVDAVQLEKKDHATPFGASGAAFSAPSRRQIPWVVGGTSLEAPVRETDPSFSFPSGSAGLMIRTAYSNPNNIGWEYGRFVGVETVVPVAPNATYTFSGSTRYAGGFEFRVLDGVTVLGTSGVARFDPWGRRAITFTTGPATSSVRIQYRSSYPVPATLGIEQAFLDALQLEQKDHATPYGSTGAANATTSRRQTPWTAGGTAPTTLARTTDEAASGVASLELTSNYPVTDAATTTFLVTPSTNYLALASAKGESTTRDCYVQIDWFRADGLLSNVRASDAGILVSVSPGGWEDLSVAAISPSDAVRASVRVVILETAPGEIHYIDKIGFFPNPSDAYPVDWTLPTEWELIAERFDTATSYHYDDYTPPNGHVKYAVVEVTQVSSTYIEEERHPTFVDLYSSYYWLIHPTDASKTIQLRNITADSFADEHENEVKHLIGRGRKVDVGDRYGKSGSLSGRIYNTAKKSARQIRLDLEQARNSNSYYWLRNPFGDIWKIWFTDPKFSRVAGVGQNELVDISFDYVEVF